jgi:hypothetical protein
MNMTVTVRGLDLPIARLKSIAANIKPTLRTATDRAVKYVHGQVPPYPPERPGQTYVRTGTLGREINTAVRDFGSEVYGVIGTPTEYAPWVISDTKVPDGRGPQAWMHQGRWWTLQEVVRGCRDAIVQIYEQAIAALVG